MPRIPRSLFSRLDLPTFERPMKAISGAPSRGKSPGREALIRISHVVTIIDDGPLGVTRPGHRPGVLRRARRNTTVMPGKTPRDHPRGAVLIRVLRSLCEASNRLLVGHRARDPFVEILVVLFVDLPRRLTLQGDLQDIIHRVDQTELKKLLDVVRNVGEVLLVVARQDDGAYPETVRREDLLFHAADRQHLAAQRDLAGH